MTPLGTPRFTGLTDQDAQVLIMYIEQTAAAAAQESVRVYHAEHCLTHEQRTSALEAVLFGLDVFKNDEAAADYVKVLYAYTRLSDYGPDY